jgi:hypothetical protein
MQIPWNIEGSLKLWPLRDFDGFLEGCRTHFGAKRTEASGSDSPPLRTVELSTVCGRASGHDLDGWLQAEHELERKAALNKKEVT